MPTQLCSKCPLGPEVCFPSRKLLAVPKGPFTLPQGDVLGLPPGPWSQERQRPRQRKEVDPFSLSASDMLLHMACCPGCSHSSHKASVFLPGQTQDQSDLPSQHPTHSKSPTRQPGSPRGKCDRITNFPLRADGASGISLPKSLMGSSEMWKLATKTKVIFGDSEYTSSSYAEASDRSEPHAHLTRELYKPDSVWSKATKK